ncbi:unnamed protein product [Cylicostephanus goldi]|uniref:Uncharacterized protein n=1 Tax=Cylicostephanus goldi TaxID=71465 RepID=A0A3P7QJM8_CYLGO|nr:unnamed protein product [Cylicostephanus goldi]
MTPRKCQQSIAFCFRGIMERGAAFVLLEPVDYVDEQAIHKRMTSCGFKNISITDVTKECKAAESAFYSDHNLRVDSSICYYVLINASL